MILRTEVGPGDVAAVRALVTATGMFHPEEVDIAAELVQERLRLGDGSGYQFLLADGEDGRLAGYACFGPVPCTKASWDLYWIAVEPRRHGRGIGRRLLEESERRIAAAGGARVYVDTSGRPAYAPTRAFYERCGYGQAACLEDFYAVGDAKIIYVKRLDA